VPGGSRLYSALFGDAHVERSRVTRSGSLDLQCVAHLIEKAGRALWSDRDEADRYIQSAISLLRAAPAVPELAVSDVYDHETRREDVGKLATWRLTRVTNYIEANLSERISVPQLAETAGLSMHHFTRAFFRSVGETPYSFVIRRRMEYAVDLLVHTERPLAEVALECGFSDQAHLSKVFRSRTRMTPGDWRRLHGTARLAGGPPSAELSTAR